MRTYLYFVALVDMILDVKMLDFAVVRHYGSSRRHGKVKQNSNTFDTVHEKLEKIIKRTKVKHNTKPRSYEKKGKNTRVKMA